MEFDKILDIFDKFGGTRSFPDKGQQIFDTSAVSYFFPNLDYTLSLMSGLEYTIPSHISDSTKADF